MDPILHVLLPIMYSEEEEEEDPDPEGESNKPSQYALQVMEFVSLLL